MKCCPRCLALYPAEFTVCPKDGTALRPVTDLPDGSVLRGKYKILGKLGEGGMGVVYKAQHLHFDEVFALKVVSGHLAAEPGFLQRFRTEALLMRRLNHPHAVRVHDFDETEDGRPFMAMEFVEGRSLAALLNAERLDPRRGVAITMQVCEALGAAHRMSVVHRDIKPANILVARSPEGHDFAKVVDFGVAKAGEYGPSAGASLTGTGFVVGTPDYMSPEQAKGLRGDQLDGRSDLYSLGVVLYELLTGRRPFSGDTPIMVLMAHINAQPPDPRALQAGLPEPLVGVVLRALEKEPARRFAAAEEMRQALAGVVPLLAADWHGTAQWPGRAGPADETMQQTPAPAADTPTDRLLTPPPSSAAARPQPREHLPTRPPAVSTQEELYEPAPAKRPKWLFALAAVTTLVVAVAAVQTIRERMAAPPAQDTAASSAPAKPALSPIPAPAEKQASPPASAARKQTQPETESPAAKKIAAPPESQAPFKTEPEKQPPPPAPEPAAQPKPEPAAPAATKTASPPVSSSPPPARAALLNVTEGKRDLEQAVRLRGEIDRAPADQRGGVQQRFAATAQLAINHFQEARKIAPVQDPLRYEAVVNLARAYQLAGRIPEASEAYAEAVSLRGNDGEVIADWGMMLARANRFAEAGEVCERSSRADRVAGSTCWRTLGVVIHYNHQPKDAVAPLRRSVELNPSHAETWFVLGSALTSTAGFQAANNRVLVTVSPGTDEAFQKYLALAPGGRFAATTRAALDALRQVRRGIETQVQGPAPTLRSGEAPQRPRVNTRVIEKTEPVFPVLPRLARIQGNVKLELIVGRDGWVMEIEAKGGHPFFYGAAMDAVRRWRFEQHLVRRQPAEFIAEVDVAFNLAPAN